MSASPDLDKRLLALQAVRISSGLYFSDTLKTFEVVKDHTESVSAKHFVRTIRDESVTARKTLPAKRDLTLILRLKAIVDPNFRPGSRVQIFVYDGKPKSGKWLSSRTVSSAELFAVTISVPGSQGRSVSAAVEDTQFAVVETDYAAAIMDSADQLNKSNNDTTDMCPAPVVNLASYPTPTQKIRPLSVPRRMINIPALVSTQYFQWFDIDLTSTGQMMTTFIRI